MSVIVNAWQAQWQPSHQVHCAQQQRHRHFPRSHILITIQLMLEKYFPFKILLRSMDFFTRTHYYMQQSSTSKLDFSCTYAFSLLRNARSFSCLRACILSRAAYTHLDACLVCNQCELNMCIYLQMIMIKMGVFSSPLSRWTMRENRKTRA